MGWFFIFLIVFIVCSLLVCSFSLFPLLLFLDVYMFSLLLCSALGPGSYFMMMIVLCVLSAALGMILLMISSRKMGNDKIFVLL